VSEYLGAAGDSVAGRRQVQSAEQEVSSFGMGLQRMVDWCNIVVPPMTPSQVPYRGFDDGVEELLSFFRFGLFGSDRYRSVEISNAYGFLSNEATSVPFGLIGDGWSRAGIVGAICYAIFASVYVMAHETLLKLVFRSHPSLLAFYILVLANQCIFSFVRMGMWETIRACILYTIATTVLVVLVQPFRKVTAGRERSSPGGN